MLRLLTLDEERLAKSNMPVAKPSQSRGPRVSGAQHVSKTRFGVRCSAHLGHDDQLVEKDLDSPALGSGPNLPT